MTYVLVMKRWTSSRQKNQTNNRKSYIRSLYLKKVSGVILGPAALVCIPVGEVSAGRMPPSAADDLQRILEQQEFARHRGSSYWEDLKNELWEYLLEGVRSLTRWFDARRPAVEAWLPQWAIDLLTQVGHLLGRALELGLWVFTQLYYPSVLLIVAVISWLAWRRFHPYFFPQTTIQTDTAPPQAKSLEELRTSGELLPLLEGLRERLRARLGAAAATDHQLLSGATRTPLSALATSIFQHFEDVAYAGREPSPELIFELHDRFKAEVQ